MSTSDSLRTFIAEQELVIALAARSGIQAQYAHQAAEAARTIDRASKEKLAAILALEECAEGRIEAKP